MLNAVPAPFGGTVAVVLVHGERSMSRQPDVTAQETRPARSSLLGSLTVLVSQLLVSTSRVQMRASLPLLVRGLDAEGTAVS